MLAGPGLGSRRDGPRRCAGVVGLADPVQIPLDPDGEPLDLGAEVIHGVQQHGKQVGVMSREVADGRERAGFR